MLVAQPTAPLGPGDFDAIALTVGPWIESRHASGLGPSPTRVSGVGELGAFIRHVQFMRERHLHVRRVGFVTDGRLANLMPKLGEHFHQGRVEALPLRRALAGDFLGGQGSARAGDLPTRIDVVADPSRSIQELSAENAAGTASSSKVGEGTTRRSAAEGAGTKRC